MASGHPYKQHHELKAAKKRVSHILKGHKSGGKASTAGADRKLFKGIGAGLESKAPGKKGAARLDKYARGGRAKKHGNHVNIAIVNPHRAGDQGAAPPAPPPVAPALGGGAPPMPPPSSMGGGAPGLPPGMPMKPPGMGMMKRGGKVKMTAGGDSGLGRIQKTRAYGKNAKKR